MEQVIEMVGEVMSPVFGILLPPHECQQRQDAGMIQLGHDVELLSPVRRP